MASGVSKVGALGANFAWGWGDAARLGRLKAA
jgi:hypothetical protein